MKTGHPILFFDGVCNLCNESVQFVIQRDKKGKIKYAALQSAFGQQMIEKYGFRKDQLDTVVLLEGQQIYTRSDVPLRIFKHLGGGWTMLAGFQIIPRFIRDRVYNFIAANRYRWFGKKESCMMPRPEWQERFLD